MPAVSLKSSRPIVMHFAWRDNASSARPWDKSAAGSFDGAAVAITACHE
jgi:hypothetical protein